ncbi:hypothetical protein INT45_002225 [Circinella minor]|uniref:Uncharacterized protein n=1 Tax=Circinella minor TaxID=1195481 RepID=A0A8H7VNU9_9FUNG|nr:hypothetical protein INT45_002225 [Circinella minor]
MNRLLWKIALLVKRLNSRRSTIAGAKYFMETSPFGSMCTRHGSPISFASIIQFGEKFKYPLAVMGEVFKHFYVSTVDIFYGVCCVFHKAVENTFEDWDGNCAVSIFYAYSRTIDCQLNYDPRYLHKSFGLADERCWAFLKSYISAIRHMSAEHRLLTLTRDPIFRNRHQESVSSPSLSPPVPSGDHNPIVGDYDLVFHGGPVMVVGFLLRMSILICQTNCAEDEGGYRRLHHSHCIVIGYILKKKNRTVHELEQKWIIRKIEIENKVQNFAVSNTDQKHEKLLLVFYGACAGKQTLIDQLNKDGEVRNQALVKQMKRAISSSNQEIEKAFSNLVSFIREETNMEPPTLNEVNNINSSYWERVDYSLGMVHYHDYCRSIDELDILKKTNHDIVQYLKREVVLVKKASNDRIQKLNIAIVKAVEENKAVGDVAYLIRLRDDAVKWDGDMVKSLSGVPSVIDRCLSDVQRGSHVSVYHEASSSAELTLYGDENGTDVTLLTMAENKDDMV